jgi:YMGG-like Gly-zipper
MITRLVPQWSAGGTITLWTRASCRLSARKYGGGASKDGVITHMNTIQKWSRTAALRAFAVIVGLSLLVMVMTACGTVTGAAVGAGSGAAIGAAAGDAKKGALIGAGVGAAGGAIYDVTR